MKTCDDVELLDSSGADTPIFIACHDCFLHERAEFIVDVRALAVANKTKAISTMSCLPKNRSREYRLIRALRGNFLPFSCECLSSLRPHYRRL